MNYKVIGKYIGHILLIESILMVPSLGISLAEGHGRAVTGFLVAICASFAAAMVLHVLCRNTKKTFYAREGMVCVGLCWIMLSFFGCLPFYVSGEIPHFVDALFETVSGFTTTGASILPEVEPLSNGILFWRSFTHWVGGMGVLVFVMAVLPMTDGPGTSARIRCIP